MSDSIMIIKKININENYKKISDCILFKFCNPPYFTLLNLMSEQIKYSKNVTVDSLWKELKPATILKFPIIYENKSFEDYLVPNKFYSIPYQHKYEYCSFNYTENKENDKYNNIGSNEYNNIGSVFIKTTNEVNDEDNLGFQFSRGYVIQHENIFPIFNEIDETYVWLSPQSQYDTKRITYYNINYLDNDFTRSHDKYINMNIELNKGYSYGNGSANVDFIYWDEIREKRIHSNLLSSNEKRFLVPYYDSSDEEYNYNNSSDDEM